MTRNPPDGQQQYGGYPPQQPQYGGQAQYGGQPQYGGPPQYGAGYGNYQSGEYNQQQNYQHPPPGEYNQQQNYQQPSPGYGSDQGSAHGYYGSNDQAYQQYPPQHQQSYPPQGYHEGGSAAPYPQHQQPYGQPDQYSSPLPQHASPQQSQYGQEYPPVGQHYAQQPSGEVDAFRSHFDQPHAQPNASGYYAGPAESQYPPGAMPGAAAEGDRGIMGALGGAALGGYGGHKVNHGFLGAAGGAVAGHFAEEAFKKSKKAKKNKNKPPGRRGSRSSSSSSSSDSDSDGSKKKRRGISAGNFHASCQNVRLEGSRLVADARDCNGQHRRSELDLNACLTNTNGKIGWARNGNFAASARNLRLADRGRVLEAELGDGRGGWAHNEIDLSERIGNDNGRLHML